MSVSRNSCHACNVSINGLSRKPNWDATHGASLTLQMPVPSIYTSLVITVSEYAIANVVATLLTDIVLAMNYTWIPSVINVCEFLSADKTELFKISVCAQRSLNEWICHPVGKFIYGFLWMTIKGIMTLPMPICLTDPTLWRKWITLQLD